MKSGYFLWLTVFLSLVSCTNKQPGIKKVQTNQPTAIKPYHSEIELSNDSVWQKIIQSPDSAAIPFLGESSVKTILLSGVLDSAKEYFQLKKVRVILDKGKSQTLSLPEGIYYWRKFQSHSYILEWDVNFDNKLDFSIFDNSGFVNFWYTTWLAKNDTLTLSNSISQIPSPRLISADKQIISYFRFGGCAESVGYYKIINNDPVPFMYVWNQEELNKSYPNGHRCFTYQKQLIGDKWDTSNLGGEYNLYNSFYKN